MEVLFSFLNWASSFSHVDEESGSKMDIHNLATVMAPNVLHSNNKNFGVEDSFLAIEAVSSLIEYSDSMCEVGDIPVGYMLNKLVETANILQVPQDLQSILNDSTLFNGSADITTKEILKRYGDIGKTAGLQLASTTVDAVPIRNSSGRGTNAPMVTRIDKDPSQATAWQLQSSVRHVQGPSGAPQVGQTSSPQLGFDASSAQPTVYQHQSDNGDNSSGYQGQQQQQLAYRSRQGVGPVGVTD
jgi:hypothetical protein